MTRFAIFGDSYITRLKRYCNGTMTTSGICRFFGKSGMTTTRKFQETFEQMLNYQPDVVFINLAGNEVNSGTSVELVVHRLNLIIEQLRSSGVQKIFVASIVERGSFWASTGMTRPKFNRIRRAINRKLRELLGSDFIDMGKKLRYPRHYDDDLIHPGARQGGMSVMHRMIKKCFDCYVHG